jgi:DNA-binding SARP family transcriptional activator
MTSATRVTFGVLGPLEVRVGERPVPVAGPRQRLVLGALLLRANQTVTMSDLMATAWEDPPRTAWRQVQNAISQVRRLLTRLGAESVVRSATDGYQLSLGADQLDLHQFEERVARGRRHAAADRPAEAAAELRDALALWRGPVLANIGGAALVGRAARLDEDRLGVLEECLALELACGDGRDLVAELAAMVTDHPLREGLAAALMLALYRGGRQAEALAVYRRVAVALADELGVDPGPPLRRRLEQILRADPELEYVRAGPAAPVRTPARPEPALTRPAQLPAAPPLFVGREAALHRLDALLPTSDPAAPGGGPGVAAVSGTAGVGKTALVLHWARGVADRFPDGQLYVNLRGYECGGPATSPEQALRGFLDALDVPTERIPAAPHAQVSLYRSLLAERRLLIVLDNALDSDQVRPLLPGTPGCRVVVTSRDQLTSLVATEGAHPVPLDLLTTDEARELLVRRLGADRAAAEPGAVADIITWCARLPFALSIVSARASVRPGFPLGALAAELRETGGRLDALRGGDTASDVRAALSWSYGSLGTAAARLFRLIGLHWRGDVSAPAAASLAGLTVAEVRPLLAELCRSTVLVEPEPGRFASHDLLRSYAAEVARAHEPGPARTATVIRGLDHYLHSAWSAARRLDPHRDAIGLDPPSDGVTVVEFADAAGATAWFTREHRCLVAAVVHAAGAGHDHHAWRLAWCLGPFLDRRGHWHDAAAVHANALAAAGRLGDPLATAHAHAGLGVAQLRLGRLEDAREHLGRALDHHERAGDQVGQARTRYNLAMVCSLMDRHREALRHAERARDVFAACAHTAGEASAHNAIGWAYTHLGEHRRAVTHCSRSLALHRGIANRRGEAEAWDSLGFVHHNLGDHHKAVTCYGHALELYTELGNRYSAAGTLHRLGDTHESAGHPDSAASLWRHAASILDDLGHPDAAIVRTKLHRLAPAGEGLDGTPAPAGVLT